MNLTLGSSCPWSQPLSTNRWALPLTVLTGSVHRSPASFLTVLYCGLQPAPSSSFVALGVTVPAAPAAGAVLAVVEALATPVMPARLSWHMTATPSIGISSSRHLRQPADCAPRPNLGDERCPDQGIRICDPSRSRVPPVPVPPRGRRSRHCDRPAIRDAFRRNLTTSANNRQ